MDRRIELHEILCSILGNRNVYFQPPTNIKLKYPCIIYTLSDIKTMYADNIPYKNTKRYDVMVINLNPDSEIPDKILELPSCLFDRFYVGDNLNHYVFKLYY